MNHNFLLYKNGKKNINIQMKLVDWNFITPLATHHPEPHCRVLIPTLSY